jgi:hypothetical protein
MDDLDDLTLAGDLNAMDDFDEVSHLDAQPPAELGQDDFSAALDEQMALFEQRTKANAKKAKPAKVNRRRNIKAVKGFGAEAKRAQKREAQRIQRYKVLFYIVGNGSAIVKEPSLTVSFRSMFRTARRMMTAMMMTWTMMSWTWNRYVLRVGSLGCSCLLWNNQLSIFSFYQLCTKLDVCRVSAAITAVVAGPLISALPSTILTIWTPI